MLLNDTIKTTWKVSNKIVKFLHEQFLEAKYGDDRDIMILLLDGNKDKIIAKEIKKDFSLHYVSDFKVTNTCIEDLRKDIGMRCLMFRKEKPKLVVLIPTVKAIKTLGVKCAYRLLFKDSWKGQSIDPFDEVVAEYKVLL